MAMDFRALFITMALATVFLSPSTAQTKEMRAAKRAESRAWSRTMPGILKKIRIPEFRNDTIFLNAEVFTHGHAITIEAQKPNNKKAIENAIKQLHTKGGGVVVLRPGVYVCNGSIELLSNTQLHLKPGARLVFGANPQDYLPAVKVRWEGTVCYNYQPLIRANGAKNIALTGAGEIDGGADDGWHKWKKQPDGNDQEKDKKTLRNMGRDGVPEAERLFGDGHKLRPSLIEFYECENVLIEGVTLRQSPFWTVHPVFCTNVTIRRLTIEPGTTNDDGIDPDGCRYVLIEDCEINTDDDPVSIKAGRDNDAWPRMPAANMVVRNIRGRSKVGNGFCIGSEMSGGVENVFVENYRISKADNGINIKSNLDRGGYVRNVFLRNVVIDSAVKNGILMQKDYHSYRGGNHPPRYSDIHLQNIAISYVEKTGIRLAGVASQAINKVFLTQVTIARQGQPNVFQYLSECMYNAQNISTAQSPEKP